MLIPLLLVNLIPFSSCQYMWTFGGAPFLQNSLFPHIEFKACQPKGLEVIIKKSPSVLQLERFQYSKNNGPITIANLESNAVTDWRFFDPSLQLEVGDFVNYTITIISTIFDPTRAFRGPNGKFGIQVNFGAQRYTYSDTQIWNVAALDLSCGENNLRLASKEQIFEDTPIYQDNFSNGVLNRDLWSVEQYIPQYSEENFEFVSYEDINECVFVSDSKLHLRPVVREISRHHDFLDLRKKCTRNTTHACFHRQIGANYLPPIKSGKVVSNFEIKYGTVEIRAKLPIGDWIFPVIELIPSDLTVKYPKFIVAYSRGNRKLATKDGKQIGGSILYGGYVSSAEDMKQLHQLRSVQFSNSDWKKMNTFTITWTPNKIKVAINGDVYSTTYQTVPYGNFKIALGVGVGGNVDFPNDVISGTYSKPWRNDAAKQIKHFVDAKTSWINTWTNNDVGLEIDYIKVFKM